MPLTDDRDYGDLLEELLQWIPVDTPDWSDFNESDPGVTLVQFFEFLAENLLWQIDERQRQRRRQRRLAVLIVGAAGLGAIWGASKLLTSRDERRPDESSP